MIMKSYVVSLLLFLLLTVPGLAQTRDAVSTLEGIGIGTSLEQARSLLARIGTGGGRDTRDGGRKEAWTLKETDFSTLAFKTNGKGKVVWLSAFVRPGKEIPFEKVGSLPKATMPTKSEAIWNMGNSQEVIAW
jgi:hypothetical protein